MPQKRELPRQYAPVAVKVGKEWQTGFFWESAGMGLWLVYLSAGESGYCTRHVLAENVWLLGDECNQPQPPTDQPAETITVREYQTYGFQFAPDARFDGFQVVHVSRRWGTTNTFRIYFNTFLLDVDGDTTLTLVAPEPQPDMNTMLTRIDAADDESRGGN